MEILKYLKDDLLIITNESYKEQILLNLKSMYRLKFMSMKEFIRNLTFSYDERSVYYLMKKYNLNYDVAKMYLENIYHETDIKEKKVEKLKQIRQELDDSNLLIYNKYFKDYLKTVDIIVYNYDVNNYEKSKIQEIEKITKVTYLNDSSIKKEQVVYEFSNIEEEIVYVATQIRKLMEKNVPLSSIKIVNIDDTYINSLKRIFDFFNINIDLNDEYIYSNVLVNKFLIQLKETKDISMALKSLENNLEIYEKVLNICNKYAFVNDVDEYVITCIEEELKTTRLKNLQENIKVVNLDNYFSNNDYVFLMNFNQKSIPKIHKDEDYSNKRNSPKDYLEWIDKKTKIIINSPEFLQKSKECIIIGDVVWVEFGFNIGEEFSGRHPAVILKNGGKTLLVLPITSKQPTPQQLASKIYIELGKIYNFKSMRRWVNIFNICPISIERIDFTKKKGNIKGTDLDSISKAFLNSDLFKYLQTKNNS